MKIGVRVTTSRALHLRIHRWCARHTARRSGALLPSRPRPFSRPAGFDHAHSHSWTSCRVWVASPAAGGLAVVALGAPAIPRRGPYGSSHTLAIEASPGQGSCDPPRGRLEAVRRGARRGTNACHIRLRSVPRGIQGEAHVGFGALVHSRTVELGGSRRPAAFLAYTLKFTRRVRLTSAERARRAACRGDRRSHPNPRRPSTAHRSGRSAATAARGPRASDLVSMVSGACPSAPSDHQAPSPALSPPLASSAAS